MQFKNIKKFLINLHTKQNYITKAINFITKNIFSWNNFAPSLMTNSQKQKRTIMQNKITRIIMLLSLLIPISSYSMPDAMFKIGLGTGIFVIITILIVVSYVIGKTVSKKEIKK